MNGRTNGTSHRCTPAGSAVRASTASCHPAEILVPGPRIRDSTEEVLRMDRDDLAALKQAPREAFWPLATSARSTHNMGADESGGV